MRFSRQRLAVYALTSCLLCSVFIGCLGGKDDDTEEVVGCQGEGAEDSDYDGVPNCEDRHPGCDDYGADMNGDGIPDECES